MSKTKILKLKKPKPISLCFAGFKIESVLGAERVVLDNFEGSRYAFVHSELIQWLNEADAYLKSIEGKKNAKTR